MRKYVIATVALLLCGAVVGIAYAGLNDWFYVSDFGENYYIQGTDAGAVNIKGTTGITGNTTITGDCTVTGALTQTGAVTFTGATTHNGGIACNEDLAVTLNATDEEVLVTTSGGDYDAGAGVLTVYGSYATGQTNTCYLQRLAHKATGDANNGFILCEDASTGAAGNGTDKFAVNYDGSLTCAGAVSCTSITASGDVAVNGDDITCDGDLTITPTGDDVKIDGGLTVGASGDPGDNNLIVDGTLTQTGVATFTAMPVLNGGADINEDIDIDFDATDEEVNLTFTGADYDAGSGVITIFDNCTGGQGNTSYLLRAVRKANGDANDGFILCEDNSTGAANNGDDKFIVDYDGNTTIAGTLTMTGAIDASTGGISDVTGGVTAGEIADATRCIALPITSFTGTGGELVLSASTTPGFETDNNTTSLVWGNGEATAVYVSFKIPENYSSGLRLNCWIDGSAADATPVSIDLQTYSNASGTVWDSTAQDYTAVAQSVDQGTPQQVSFAINANDAVAGNMLTVALWAVDSTGSSDTELYAVEAEMLCTQ